MCKPLGELEVNYEAFVDHDEGCHGPMDSADNRRAYPENFDWSCCDATGDAIGCVRGMHEAGRKRRRVS